MRNLVFFLIFFIFVGCKKENIDGIIVGNTLLENQTLEENRKLDTIIKSTLNGNHNSLRRLIHFPCYEGAGCYDKGFIITQVIYKIGERKFGIMIDKLDIKELGEIQDYIKVGLEYGDNDNDNKVDNKIAEKEFPMLMEKLSTK